LFSVVQLKNSVPVFQEHCKTLIEILNGYVKSGEILDIQQLFQKFTMDSTAKILFGTTTDCMKGKSKFATNFDLAIEKTTKRFLTFWWDIPVFGKYEKDERILRKCTSFIDEYCYQTIRERKKLPQI